MDNIVIRFATREDINQVARLHVESWCSTYKGIINQDYLDNMMNNIDKRIKRMNDEFELRKMVVAIKENEIVGFSEYTDSNKFSTDVSCDCELCGLYVKNEYKNCGIGTLLFEFVSNTFRKLNRSKMLIWCLEDNCPAISFYKKKGGNIEKIKNIEINNKKYNEVALSFKLI